MTWESNPIPHFDLLVGGPIEAEIEFDGDHFCCEDRPWRLVVNGCFAARFETLEKAMESGSKTIKARFGLHVVSPTEPPTEMGDAVLEAK